MMTTEGKPFFSKHIPKKILRFVLSLTKWFSEKGHGFLPKHIYSCSIFCPGHRWWSPRGHGLYTELRVVHGLHTGLLSWWPGSCGGSHWPYQIVESEKILSRMIFQSQLWLLLLLSFWDYGHRVMTLCHQLFCRKIFQHEENEGGSR